MNEKVSVVIPCYNRATLVGETLENMLQQSLPPYEVIVVDDGSTDNSVEVIERFGSRVTLIKQTNQGPGVARNTGYKASTGDFIQFMDSDDLASRKKLEVQVAALNKSDADFAYCPWVRCKIESGEISFLDKILQSREVPSKKSMLEWFLSGWSLVFQNCLFRRSVIARTGGYRTDLLPSEDSEYFVRILLAGSRPIHTPECLVFYREHGINKISDTGTSAIHRANDWTHFLNITGNLLNGKLAEMKLSTKIALATDIRNHINYCDRNGLKILEPGNPYSSIRLPFKSFLLYSYSYYKRFQRKLKGSRDYNKAFMSITPTEFHKDLIEEIGYNKLRN